MPDKAGGNALTKKAGPLPRWGWVAVAGGTYLLYRWYANYKANQAAAAASGTTGGTTIPAGTSGVGSTGEPATSTTSSTGFSDFGSWQNAFIAAMTAAGLNSVDSLNGVQDWLNGQCVNAAQYNGINTALTSVGLPPGWGTALPTVSVCPSSSAASSSGGSSTAAATTPAPTPTPAPTTPSVASLIPPNLPASIVAAMTNNGEHIVSQTFDTATSTWLYLTNKGGVYTLNTQGQPGGTFYGSYYGLNAAHGPGPNGLPASSRTFESINANPDGTYTLTDTWGENYTFNQSTLAAESGQKAA